MRRFAEFARRPRVRATAAAVLAVAMIGGVLAAGLAVGKQQGRQVGREEAAATLPADAGEPVLRSSDGTCGSRFELVLGDRVYALFLDSTTDTRLALLDPPPDVGCDPDYTGDPTGAETAKVLTGWDRREEKCVAFTVIDGRRWILGAEVGGYLAPGEGRVIAGDARCGGELPAEPLGEGVCKRPYGWNYGWDAARGYCLPVP